MTTTSLCTATTTVPSTCEYKVGNWCAKPLPNFNNKVECLLAAKSCALQVVSCFKYAGFPNTVECFEYKKWCAQVAGYCVGCAFGKCDKADCWEKNKPGKGQPPTTKTSVFPCPATSTAAPPTTTTACPPEPTNICKQPSNSKWGYGPGKPVGGIALPVVGCNDDKDDWSKNPFKLYTEPDSKKCLSFPWPAKPNVCQDTCNEQYKQCKDVYVQSCYKQRRRRTPAVSSAAAGDVVAGGDGELDRRTFGFPFTDAWKSLLGGGTTGSDSCARWDISQLWNKEGSDGVSCWGWGANNPKTAGLRCDAQWKDCLAANKNVSPGDNCKTYCADK